MHSSWVSLLPPLFVIIAVFFTKNINRSLLIGIISAALIAANFSPIPTSKLLIERAYNVLGDKDTLLLYLFLFILGMVISLIARTGGAYAFAHYLAKQNLSKRKSEYYSMLVSALLSIDDYLNTLTVGYVMRPITDRLAIPRTKLAFLIHSMANGVIMLLPISSWVAALTSTLDQAGITDSGIHIKIVADPFLIYLRTIPFIFYGSLMVFVVALLIHTQLSFGPMKKYENDKQNSQTDSLYAATNDINQNKHGSLTDLILPLILLIGSIILGSLWAGDFFLFGGKNGIIEAIKNNSQLQRGIIMCVAGTISFIISWLIASLRNKVASHSFSSFFVDSYRLMSSAVVLILLAAILGTILRIDLQTGYYLANLLLGAIPLFLLPVIIFFITLLLATITGSAFGSMMLLIPIAVPMIIMLHGVTVPTTASALPLLLPVLGALFSGAVCGNQVSPISDTTIMVATSTNVEPGTHAKTQFPYALIAITGTALSCLAAGILRDTSYWFNVVISLTAGMLSCIFIIYSIAFLQRKS